MVAETCVSCRFSHLCDVEAPGKLSSFTLVKHQIEHAAFRPAHGGRTLVFHKPCPNTGNCIKVKEHKVQRGTTEERSLDNIQPFSTKSHFSCISFTTPPVKFRIEIKIVLTYKALNNMAPSYLKERIVPVKAALATTT